MTITEFLLARIAEREEAARAASHAGPRWKTPTVHGPIVAIDNDTEWGGDPVVYDEGSPSEDQAAHIALNDPAHVLAECEAKRRIVARHEVGDDCGYWDVSNCPDMRDLASVFADHPGFQDEWRSVG